MDVHSDALDSEMDVNDLEEWLLQADARYGAETPPMSWSKAYADGLLADRGGSLCPARDLATADVQPIDPVGLHAPATEPALDQRFRATTSGSKDLDDLESLEDLPEK